MIENIYLFSLYIIFKRFKRMELKNLRITVFLKREGNYKNLIERGKKCAIY